ncbi:MAG: hypothetical protein ACI9R3_006079 [Verrucomicrobiales bacterium]|jgi:hypothetical protein
MATGSGRLKLRSVGGTLVVGMCLVITGCYEQVTDGVDSDEMKKRVADASITFQANHDSDRREEVRLLYPRTEVGWTVAEVSEFLGDPAPGISTEVKWVYDLGGKDSFTLYFGGGLLKTKHWLQTPVEVAAPSVVKKKKAAPAPAAEEDIAVDADETPNTREQGTGPRVSTGSSR